MPLPFADLALARRLERTEGRSCVAFAEARRRLAPESGAEWMECAGAYAVFDGVNSPITQSFGLGVCEELTPRGLDEIEAFFRERGASVEHEVCPLAGVSALDLLCSRHYRPIEISNVLYRVISKDDGAATGEHPDIQVRAIGTEDAQLWTDVSARSWAHEHPEYLDFHRDLGKVCTARENSVCFLAEHCGEPGAAGALCLNEGVALFAGASTVPELRRRGLQGALMNARLRYGIESGCDLAMLVAQAGSNSQRNAERKGFRVAYTRTKWKLFPAS